MSRDRLRELNTLIGPPDTWLLSVEDIEQVMLSGPCRHLIDIQDCRVCLPSALTRRQMTILAERLGCSAGEAQAVSDKLCNEYLEERR